MLQSFAEPLLKSRRNFLTYTASVGTEEVSYKPSGDTRINIGKLCVKGGRVEGRGGEGEQ